MAPPEETLPETRAIRHGRSAISLLLLVGLGVLAYNFYFICAQKQLVCEQKLSEIGRLEGEIAVLKQENAILDERVAYFGTDAGIEEVAREKLGLVRQGEVAFVVVPSPATRAPDAPVYIPRPAASRPSLMQKALHAIFQPGFPSTR